jgi:integrase
VNGGEVSNNNPNEVRQSLTDSTSPKEPATSSNPDVDLSIAVRTLLQPIAAMLYQMVDQCVASRLSSPTARVPAASVIPAVVPNAVVKTRSVGDVVEELLFAKKADGVSGRYLETIRSHLRRFAHAFNVDIGSVTTPEIEHWLRQQKVGARSRNNMRSSVIVLFHFAQKQGFLPKGKPTEADDIARAKDRGGNIGILKPADLARVLCRAEDGIQLFIVLGAFTGMRSSEILRLEWRDVNFDRAFITVSAEKAKTATRRLVPVLPNLMCWLTPYRGRVGGLFRGRRCAMRAIAFAKGCSMTWPNNALRHSYATYRLALTADAARVALEMGNSPQKLMTNYRELADQNDAEAWFSIVPIRGSTISH